MCREPKQNLSENLLRDFEQSWWTTCREVSFQLSLTLGSLGSERLLLRHSKDLESMTQQQFSERMSAWQGNVERIRHLLSTSARVLANTVDENRRRSALWLWWLAVPWWLDSDLGV